MSAKSIITTNLLPIQSATLAALVAAIKRAWRFTDDHGRRGGRRH